MGKKREIKKETVAAKITENIKEKIDQIVKESEYLGLTESQVVSEILEMYFNAKHPHGEKIRGKIIEKKKKEGWYRKNE